MNPNRTPLGRRLAALRGEYAVSASAVAASSGIPQTMMTATETGDRVADTRAVGAILSLADVSLIDLERLAALWAAAGLSGQACHYTLCPSEGCETPAALTALASSRLSPEAWHQIAGIVRGDLDHRCQSPASSHQDAIVEAGGVAYA